MKKFITGVMSIAVVAAMTITAFAANPITGLNGTDSKNVTGTYSAGSTAATVYKMDVAWGAMEFTYSEATEGTWNADTHTFSGSVAAGWSWTDNTNYVTVTNHSNTAVDAELAFAPTATGVTGSFFDASKNGTAISGSKLSLADASVGASLGDVSKAPKATAYLQITGGSIAANATIGTVTVTLK